LKTPTLQITTQRLTPIPYHIALQKGKNWPDQNAIEITQGEDTSKIFASAWDLFKFVLSIE